jgi:ParB-like chromosome segregation protein Spo0J
MKNAQTSGKTDKRVIEYVALDKLTPYARNSRTHSPEQVKQIAASIREFGFTNPVLIDDEGTIIAGHGRVLAAQHLQLADVPCIRLGYLSETQRRAYVIADNKLALNAGWDEELLTIELSDFHACDFNVAILGFNADELSKLMGYGVDVVDAPELPVGDREPFRQMTFTLHDTQYEAVEAAIKKAKDVGGGKSDVNENSNGNALAAICEAFNG